MIIEIKPYRQKWLSNELMHSAPTATLCNINGQQYVQLEHPLGGPLTCVKNRTGMIATGMLKIDGKWNWVIGDSK